MIDYITYILIAIIISGDLFSIYNTLIGKYTSVFVSYFTVASVAPNHLKNLAKNKEIDKKFKMLVILSEISHILITLFFMGGILLTSIPNIVWICLLSYYTSSIFFRYHIRKLFKNIS